MNIFVNCNNLTAFREFVKTYSSENKKHHFIFGAKDYFTDIYYRKIVDCPRYYETYDVQENEKSLETANYKSIARNINTTLMHIGGLYKMKVLENIMEAYNGKIQ